MTLNATQQDALDKFVDAINGGVLDDHLKVIGAAVHARHLALQTTTEWNVIAPYKGGLIKEEELIEYGENKYLRKFFIGQEFNIPEYVDSNAWAQRHKGERVRIVGARTKFKVLMYPGTQDEEVMFRPFGQFPYLFGKA